MLCPHCTSERLVMSERSGIEIDYCPNCRGVWLDRGELDKLIEWVNIGSPLTAVHEGEHLFAHERLVVSPAAGVFNPIGGLTDGTIISVGTVLGTIGDVEVRSPFAGELQSYIAVDGERVTLRQPIAWLRTA